MKKINEQKKRINFLYYEEKLTQKEIGELLGISRQRVSSILNSNVDHKYRKSKRDGTKNISRKVQFPNSAGPTISIPKDMFKRIGITEEFREAEVKVEGPNIIIKRKRK